MKDWLSPILVKELRQGLRARVFEGASILLQLLMVLSVVVAVLGAASRRGQATTGFAEGLFWTMIGIPVVLVMPLRGVNALKREIDARTLELIFLTRLTAWRIVAGKWAALFSQTCLLVCAALPYVVLRYFLGSVDLLADLSAIVIMLGTSGLLTALAVSTSAFTSKLARGLMVLLPIALFYIVPYMALILFSRAGLASRSLHLRWPFWVGFAFYGTAAILYLLQMGAARIAPPAENHAIRKRLIGLAVLLSGPVAVLFGVDDDILVVNMFLLAPVLFDALCVPWRPLPSLHLPLIRLGPAGRVLAPMLLPGWPSGFLYALLVAVGTAVVLFIFGRFGDDELLLYVSGLGTLLVPLAMIRLALPRLQRIGVAYFTIQLTLLIFTTLYMMVDNLFDLDLLGYLAVSPLSTLMLNLGGKADETFLAANALVAVASIAVIVLRDRQPWRDLVALDGQARAMQAAIRPDPQPL